MLWRTVVQQWIEVKGQTKKSRRRCGIACGIFGGLMRASFPFGGVGNGEAVGSDGDVENLELDDAAGCLCFDDITHFVAEEGLGDGSGARNFACAEIGFAF